MPDFTIETESGIVLGFQNEVKAGKADVLELLILEPGKRFQTTKKAIVARESLGIPLAKVPLTIGTAKPEDQKTAEDVVLFEPLDDLKGNRSEREKLEKAQAESKAAEKALAAVGR